MDIKGLVKVITEPTQVTEKYRKREVVVEYAENPQYPELLKFEAGNDKCDLLDKVKVGDEVEVHFNLTGRKWTDKEGVDVYFNTLRLWKISVVSAGAVAETPATAVATPAPVNSPDPNADDLPF